MRNWMEDMADDILNSRWKNITNTFIRPRHFNPQPHPFVQVDPTRTRDKEGYIKERPARSAQEALLGTQQTHHNWTNTAGEQTDLHGCTQYQDQHENVQFDFKQNPSAPTDEEIRNLFRPDLPISRDTSQKSRMHTTLPP